MIRESSSFPRTKPYAGVRAYSAYRLTKKGLPVSSASYATHKPVWPEEPPVPPEEEKPGNP